MSTRCGRACGTPWTFPFLLSLALASCTRAGFVSYGGADGGTETATPGGDAQGADAQPGLDALPGDDATSAEAGAEASIEEAAIEPGPEPSVVAEWGPEPSVLAEAGPEPTARENGPEPTVDAGPDAADARVDAIDAASDAAREAGMEAGTDARPDAGSDAAVSDACLPPTCTTPTDLCATVENCGPDGAGNGIDDDCNGRADDTCGCTVGAVRGCFPGPTGRRNVGACADGTMICRSNGAGGGVWSACLNAVVPTAENCNGADDDCNGRTDDGLPGCIAGGACPAPNDARIPSPYAYNTVQLDATQFFPGATNVRWTVSGNDCDRMSAALTGAVGFTLNTLTAPSVVSPTVAFRPVTPGAYQVTLALTTNTGSTATCTFPLTVRATGLTVELCWDSSGTTDLDLWLHRSGTTTAWQSASAFPNDVCAYSNCPNGAATPATWGYAATAIAAGRTCNQPGSLGLCANPRLEMDNITTPGRPEIVSLDNPNAGDTFRVAANYYTGTRLVSPMVTIYCGGVPKRTLGGYTGAAGTWGGTPVSGFNTGGQNTTGSLWRAADVTFSGPNDCTVAPLVRSGTSTPCVDTSTDRTYAGPCTQ